MDLFADNTAIDVIYFALQCAQLALYALSGMSIFVISNDPTPMHTTISLILLCLLLSITVAEALYMVVKQPSPWELFSLIGIALQTTSIYIIHRFRLMVHAEHDRKFNSATVNDDGIPIATAIDRV